MVEHYQQKFGNDGWICWNCGQWVKFGELHRCTQQTANTPSTQDHYVELLAWMRDISYKLDLIIQMLQKENGNATEDQSR